MWEGQYGQKVPCRLKSQDRKSLVALRVVGLVSREGEWALRRTEKPGRQQDRAGSQGCDRKATLCLATLAMSWVTGSAQQTSQGDWGMSQKPGLGALAPCGTRTWGSASASATPTEDQPAGVAG